MAVTPEKWMRSALGFLSLLLCASAFLSKFIGEWNQEEIMIQGSKIKVTLNGTVITEADLKEATKNGTVDHNEHPGLKNTTGHIGFLGHGDVVRFKNMRIKKLGK